MPFNSGRTLPSKWDDAERWITSPVAGFGVCKSVETPDQSQKRPKAKSGPLDGAPAVAYFSNYSPAVPVLEGSSSMSFLAGSPLTTGVIVPDGFLPFCQDEKDDENGDLRVASRRDMATQMSSESSPEASPTCMPPRVEPSGHHSARLEVRDVEVDRGAAMTKQSKRHGIRSKNTPEANPLALTWNNTEGAMKLSKLQKEEARITAWENLQNAKAEASIRKLEMKLEKKKAASLDKILSKHRAAQMKAEKMRRNMSEDVSPRNSHKFRSLCRSVSNSLKVCFHHQNP
ncbi:hypothetical protein SSX86_016256 [Deinandra increscens subsp. villosa]|uniref:Remorin C-terminal domain-containing protein n=1 Tax=Deinandra increscens subsp. villosa TaxID=3103831 RepID=A0AAP0GXX2_9ASTR